MVYRLMVDLLLSWIEQNFAHCYFFGPAGSSKIQIRTSSRYIANPFKFGLSGSSKWALERHARLMLIFFLGQNTCFMLVQEKRYQNGIILKDKKLKVLTYVIFCRPEVQYMYRLIILFSILVGTRVLQYHGVHGRTKFSTRVLNFFDKFFQSPYNF